MDMRELALCVARSYNELGCMYYSAGNATEAERYFWQNCVILVRAALHSRRPPPTVSQTACCGVSAAARDDVCVNLACLCGQSRWKVDVTPSLARMGVVKLLLGRYVEATEFFEKLLRSQEMQLGLAHKSTLEDAGLLG
jgi:hypothetical protein